MNAFTRLEAARRLLSVCVMCLIALAMSSSTAEAAILKGIQEVFAGLLQVPIMTLAGTFRGPPVVGTVVGAATGVLTGVGLVAHGALELALSGVGLAKTAAPYVLPFLL